MGLTRCRECGKKVSEEATFCPHCGCPDPAIRPSEVEVVEVPAWEAPEKYGGRFKAFFITIWEGILYPRKFYPKVINSENTRPAWIFSLLPLFAISSLIGFSSLINNPPFEILSSLDKLAFILFGMFVSLLVLFVSLIFYLPYILPFAYFLSTFVKVSFNKCLRWVLYWSALSLVGVIVTCGLFILIEPFYSLFAFCNTFNKKYVEGCLTLIIINFLANILATIILAIISLPTLLLSYPK